MESINLEKKEKNTNNKFCKHCGETIPKEAIICNKCGCQVEEIKNNEQPQVVINNSNSSVNSNINNNTVNAGAVYGHSKNKWVSFALCLILGYFGAHKFYEGKIGMGILYLFTMGLFGFGWIIDCIVLFFKPNPYFV